MCVEPVSKQMTGSTPHFLLCVALCVWLFESLASLLTLHFNDRARSLALPINNMDPQHE